MSNTTKCGKCNATTVQHCDENNCGYMGAGNGAPEPMPASVPGSFNDLAALVPERNPTPGHRWENGEDPHKGRYDCTRDDLTLGDFTDDELANYAFLEYDKPTNIRAIMEQDPGYHPPIAIMAGVKDRLRWLTRQLDKRDEALSASAARIAKLEEALAFYADGDHFMVTDEDAWEDCGEALPNFSRDDEGTAYVEDGSTAKAALKDKV